MNTHKSVKLDRTIQSGSAIQNTIQERGKGMKAYITNSKTTLRKKKNINSNAENRYSSNRSLLEGQQTMKSPTRRNVQKRRGQGLIEYLILVALMGVATIGIIRVLNQTIKSRFASAVYALQGKPKKVKTDSVKEQDYKKSDLSNFMNGAASKKK